MGEQSLENGEGGGRGSRGRREEGGANKARDEYAELLRKRQGEQEHLNRLAETMETDKFSRSMLKPRKGPRWSELNGTMQGRVKKARRLSGTATSCLCYNGRGLVPAGDTRRMLSEEPLCCQKFARLEPQFRTEGMDYIMNTDAMQADLNLLPDFWDKSIGDLMCCGARMYYVGDDRDKVQEFKNQESLQEEVALTKKAFKKDLVGARGADGKMHPFIESLGQDVFVGAESQNWEGFTINSLGSTDKSDGSKRLYDNARSVNDYTFQVSMPKVFMATNEGFEDTIHDLRQRFPGKKIVVCKRDISSYFRIIKVHPEDVNLSVIKYPLAENIGAGEAGEGAAGASKGEAFFRKGASFGNRAWPCVACRATNALLYTMAKLDGVCDTGGFIDDFYLLSVVEEDGSTVEGQDSPREVAEKVDARLRRWNFPVNKKKQVEEGSWDVQVVWLGVCYNLETMMKWITEARVLKAIRSIERLLGSVRKGSKKVGYLPRETGQHDLSCVVGCLVSIAKVVTIGRTWIHEIRTLLRLANARNRGVRVHEGAFIEMRWWLKLLRGGKEERYFMRTINRRGAPTPAFLTDASGWGFGGFYPRTNRRGKGAKRSLFMRCKWPEEIRRVIGDLTRKSSPGERFRVTMEAMEAFALVAFVAATAKELSGGHHIVFVDNDPVLEAMKNGRAKRNDWTALIVRMLWEIRARFDFDLEVRRVSSKLNKEADILSRQHGLRVLLEWLGHAQMGPFEELAVPEELKLLFKELPSKGLWVPTQELEG